MHDIDQAVRLLKEYLNGNIQIDSNKELRELLDRYPNLIELTRKLEDENSLKKLIEDYRIVDDEERPEAEDSMLQYILTEIRKDSKPSVPARWGYRRIAVAASIAALFFVMFYTLRNRFTEDELTSFQIAATFTPGKNKAILETSNGKQMELSTLYGGIVVGDQVLYEDGSVLLDATAIQQNIQLTLTTPRGGQYQVSLPDGTKVWLNADSKLHYPSIFPDDNRIVSLEGEAYFEVARDENKPFIVQTAKEKVEVLGTHFNINTYSEEMSSSVALLEGKVRVSLANRQSQILSPGQQAINSHDRLKIQPVNLDECVAWKNGEFMFNNESLGSVMRKLSRWYDIDVELTKEVRDISIWGSVSRYDTFDEVLQVIKMIDDNIQFKIEGRRVRIMR